MTAIGEQSLRWFSAEQVEAETDLASVASLVSDYSGLLYRVAFSVVRNSAEAEDVVQDVFVRVLKRPGKLGGVVEVRPWLVRIAWNLAIDRRRRIRPEQIDEQFAAGLVAKSMAADDAMVEAQRMSTVLREIERLPRSERDVVLLSAIEELSTAEMGKVLAKSESAVRALLFRARARLRQRLARGGEA